MVFSVEPWVPSGDLLIIGGFPFVIYNKYTFSIVICCPFGLTACRKSFSPLFFLLINCILPLADVVLMENKLYILDDLSVNTFQQIFIFGWAVQNKIQCSLHLIQKKVEFHSLCFCILVNIFLSVNDTWMFLRIPGFSESRGTQHCCLCCPISLAFLCTVLPTTVASFRDHLHHILWKQRVFRSLHVKTKWESNVLYCSTQSYFYTAFFSPRFHVASFSP